MKTPQISSKSEYRIQIHPTNITVSYLGFNWKNENISGTYHNAKELPTEIQEKLAVLSICKITSGKVTTIEGIGTKVSDHIFWIECDS